MSTKIYGGRKIPAPINQSYGLLLEAKKEAKPLGKQIQIDWLAQRCAEQIDRARIKGEQASTPLSIATRELRDGQAEIRKTGYRNPDLDVGFELFLFPMTDETLVIVNTEQQRFQKWFDSQFFVQDFAYWNGTDRPAEIDAGEWEWRRHQWELALPGIGVLAERGLTFQIYPGEPYARFGAEEVASAIPPIEKRLATKAKDVHRNEIIKRLVAESEEPERAWDNPMSLVMRAEKIAGKQPDRLRDIRDDIAPAIREITAADLLYTETSK